MFFFLIQRGCFFFGFLGRVFGDFGHPSDPPGIKLVAWQVNSFGLLYPILVIGRRVFQGPLPSLGVVNLPTFNGWFIWYTYLHEWLIYMVNVGKYTSPMDVMGWFRTPPCCCHGGNPRPVFVPSIFMCFLNLDFSIGCWGSTGEWWKLNSNKEVNMLIETKMPVTLWCQALKL